MRDSYDGAVHASYFDIEVLVALSKLRGPVTPPQVAGKMKLDPDWRKASKEELCAAVEAALGRLVAVGMAKVVK